MAYGVTPQGFVAKQQSQEIADLQASLKQGFGANINLAPSSNFGQIIGIFTERLALLWQMGEATYSSQYPSGAEGTAVDNILAYNNLKRLGARATVTSPTENTIPGLVLYGTPGTVVPIDSIISVQDNPSLQFTLDAAVTIGSAANAVQSIIFSAIPDAGGFQLLIVDPAGNPLITPSVLPFNFSAAAVQAAIRALTDTQAGVLGSIVAGSNEMSIQTSTGIGKGMAITVAGVPAGTTVLSVAGNVVTMSAAATLTNQSAIVTFSYSPYSDVVVVGNTSTGLTITFGSTSPSGINPSSGNQPQNNFSVANSSLLIGSTVVNTFVSTTVTGTPAQGIGAATCTQTGPNFVAANTLNVIGSPTSGWSSVNNPLDCLKGSNIESDTEALTRRDTLLSSQANGPLQAIIAKLNLVEGVSAVIGVQNQQQSAQQIIFFSAVPVTGSFQIAINGFVTPTIPYTATAPVVQAALNALPGYSTALVSGYYFSGFTIDFNGSNGGQPQELVQIASNSLGVTTFPTFGIPGKSMAFTVENGSNTDIANTIYGAEPGAIETYAIPTYSRGQITSGSNQITNVSNTRAEHPTQSFSVGDQVTGLGIPNGTTIIGINEPSNSATMSANATDVTAVGNLISGNPNVLVQSVDELVVGMLVTGTGIPAATTVIDITGNVLTLSNNPTITQNQIVLTLSYSALTNDLLFQNAPVNVEDSFANVYPINFSRPVLQTIYVSVVLQTDLTTSQNPKFQRGSIATIQQDIVDLGNATPIGGLIVGFGTNGLIGAFNNVPGILGYTLYFGTVPVPTTNTAIQLPPGYQAFFETFYVTVSYT